MVMEPLFTPVQEAGDGITEATSPDPALIKILRVPVHPSLSRMVTVCEPDDNPVNTFDAWNGPPSIENV